MLDTLNSNTNVEDYFTQTEKALSMVFCETGFVNKLTTGTTTNGTTIPIQAPNDARDLSKVKNSTTVVKIPEHIPEKAPIAVVLLQNSP